MICVLRRLRLAVLPSIQETVTFDPVGSIFLMRARQNMSLDNTTLKYIVAGAFVGWFLATQMTRAEADLFVSSEDVLSAFDDTPPATAPLGSSDDLGPMMTLGARPLGGRTLGGSLLPRRVYQDPTSNNPGAYRPPSVSLRPKPPAPPVPTPKTAPGPVPKPKLKPASATASSVKGAKIAPKAKTLKSPFAPEIDSRDGMIVQPFR